MAEPLHTYYDVLRVDRAATKQGIRAAYRRLAQHHHPDKRGGHADAARAMAAINTAYAVLCDEAARAEHDAWIRSCELRASAVVPLPARRLDVRVRWPVWVVVATVSIVVSAVVTTLYLGELAPRAQRVFTAVPR